MSAFDEKREALRLLDGLENGGMAADDASGIAQDLDPVLVHVIVKFLRETYPASDPAARNAPVSMVSASPFSGSPSAVRQAASTVRSTG